MGHTMQHTRSGAVAVADAKLGPIAPGQRTFTPDQLTAMLRADGVLPDDVAVRTTTAGPLGIGESMMSDLLRLTLEFDGPTPRETPHALVVKVPCREPFRREIADRLGFYGRELSFYERLAHRVGLRTPHCYAAVLDRRSGDFTLVLEDLIGTRTVAQVEGCEWRDGEIVADALAALHAPWWGRTGELPVPVVNMSAAGNVVRSVETFVTSWPACRARTSDRLPAAIVDIGDHWRDVGPALARRLTASTTLCHGDFRVDNLRFDGDEVIAFDWQLITLAHGAADLAYFASQSMQTPARAGRDRELVQRYVGALAAAGATVDTDETWDVYRHAVLAMLIFPVTLYGGYDELDPLGRAATSAMLDRAVATITELDAWDVAAAR